MAVLIDSAGCSGYPYNTSSDTFSFPFLHTTLLSAYHLVLLTRPL
jgi:hypothetical protein